MLMSPSLLVASWDQCGGAWEQKPGEEQMSKKLRMVKRATLASVGIPLTVLLAFPAQADVPRHPDLLARKQQSTDVAPQACTLTPSPGTYSAWAGRDCTGQGESGLPPAGVCRPTSNGMVSAWNNSQVPITFWENANCTGEHTTVAGGGLVNNLGLVAFGVS
ncbi:peptidase inhibitor family I36 protein [Streptomyces sp. 8N114]|uniref:peptidase inhibitor family I36 protein n=1 Tax=Streptomyces sp. 8N114 TaxID=3457419 RepID=UPI003FCFF41C